MTPINNDVHRVGEYYWRQDIFDKINGWCRINAKKKRNEKTNKQHSCIQFNIFVYYYSVESVARGFFFHSRAPNSNTIGIKTPTPDIQMSRHTLCLVVATKLNSIIRLQKENSFFACRLNHVNVGVILSRNEKKNVIKDQSNKLENYFIALWNYTHKALKNMTVRSSRVNVCLIHFDYRKYFEYASKYLTDGLILRRSYFDGIKVAE